MRCLKCGDEQTDHNINRRSCRIHRIGGGESCLRCDRNGNCYHEWTYFYDLWHFIYVIELYFYRKSQEGKTNTNYDIL